MQSLLCAALLMSVSTLTTGHAGHDHGHGHDNDHGHGHSHDNIIHQVHSDGTVLKKSTHGKGHVHNCQHDDIEDILKEAKAEFRKKQLAGLQQETADGSNDVHTVLRRRMDDVLKRRETSSYHPLRVTFDFDRLGTSTADLASGADTHKSQDFTCYDGGSATVPNSYSATNGATAFTCSSGNTFTDEKRSFLQYTLLPQAKVLLQNALTVSDADQDPNAVNEVWSGTGKAACFNSPSTSLPGECGWDPVPTKTVANSDFVLYIMARPTDTGVIAWATTLVRDPTTNRPVAGVANFNPEYLTQPKCSSDGRTACLVDSDCSSGTCSGNFNSQLGTTIHEIVHALGFSSSSWGSFVGRSRSQVVEQKVKQDGSTRSFIITPNVVAKVKEQYGCSEDTGAEIEDMGGGGTAGSHWEKRLIANEFMNPQVADNPVLFSAITLGLFEDTGWYKPNYGAARHLSWGYKQGCNFLKKTCGQGWDSRYFCNKEYKDNGGRQEGCSSFDFRGRGYCDLATYSGAITPNYYQYFTDSKLGGRESYMDYCPMYKPYSNTPCNRGAARNVNLRPTYGEHSSMLTENGFCFAGTYQFGGTSSSTHHACHEVICAPDLQTYTVKFFDGSVTPFDATNSFIEVTCPTNGGLVDLVGKFEGKIECYPANLICYVPTNCPKANGEICSGHGTCGNDLSCTCQYGYTGDTCEDRKCPDGTGGQECSGSTAGTCDSVTGKCDCEPAYDGFVCDRLKCPETTKAECNGRGACSNATWPGPPKPAGQCICTGGFAGNSCNEAPGCPSAVRPCEGQGACDTMSGACSCNKQSLQTNPLCPDYICPEPVQESCTDRKTDKSRCSYWSGVNCTDTIVFGDNITTVNGTHVIAPNGEATLSSSSSFVTASQTYQFFEFDIEKADRDVAFVATILDGTDVDIFASQDIVNPTAADVGSGYKWVAESSNDGTATTEILQICGEFLFLFFLIFLFFNFLIF